MDEFLIQKVREHEVIYNHGLPDYRDQYIRQAAWEEIGKELKITGNEAKERWDKLRRCFCNARKRRRDDAKSGIPSKKRSPWRYEQQMSFLLPFSESRKTHCNLNESELEDLSEQSEAEGYTSTPCYSLAGAQDNEPANDEAASNDVETDEKRYEVAKHIRNKKHKRLDNPAHQTVQILKKRSISRKRQYDEKTTRRQPSEITNLFETQDGTDMFFLSMARMTKQLPKFEQTQIKLALSNSVLSAEVRCNQQLLSSNTYPQPSFPQHLLQQQQSFVSSPSSAANVQLPTTSLSDYSSQGSE